MISRRTFIGSVRAYPLLLTGLSSGALSRNCAARYQGDVVAKWLGNGRDMKLVEPFEFVSTNCRRWPVPAGTTIDGASIPKPFWSLIGGPYEDSYRDASVIHDFYCETRSRKASDVHAVFYDAMLVSRVRKSLAWLMYKAVYTFGPTWPDPAHDDPSCDVVDKDFDFTKCALNAPKPAVTTPLLNKKALGAFIEQVKAEADGNDIQKLRAQLGEVPD